MAVLGSDLKGQVAMLVNPIDPVAQAGTPADIAFRGFHRDIAGKGEVRHSTTLFSMGNCAKDHGTQKDRQKLPHKPDTRLF